MPRCVRCRRSRQAAVGRARQTKPFDGAWDRVKVDQKDLDGGSKALGRRRRSAATERQRLATLGRDRGLIADDDAHHHVTKQINVQQDKQLENRINAYTISSRRGVRV